MTDPAAPTRRDFLFPATAGLAAVTLGAGLLGLGRSMAPSEDVAAIKMTVDLTDLPEGAAVTVVFLGRPLTIRHRTAAEIAAAEATDLSDLTDPLAQNLNLDPLAPATDQNRRATPDGRFLVMSLVCTHLGCVVLGDGIGDYGGWFCPCHGGQFDTAGRTRKGPPPRNLPIPVLEWPQPGILTLFGPTHLSQFRRDKLIWG
jgi:ubiquinol-cytochrome c reductase iron-sulfur subunit